MPLFRSSTFRRSLAAVAFLAVVGPALSMFAGFQPNHTLEPMDPADDSAAASASATPASSPAPAAAETVNYSGSIRRLPAGGGPAVTGYFRLAISPVGKVTGSIYWYNPAQSVAVTGKQDLDTKQGYFVVRSVNNVRVSGSPRMAFHLNKKNLLAGSGLLASGESASYRLAREANYTGNGSAGGATLTLGGASSYSGSSSANLNVGSVIASQTNVTFGSGASATSSGVSGGTVTTVTATGASLASLGAGTLTISGSTAIIASGGTGVNIPTLNADGNLFLGSSLLLLGPVTVTTGTDGTTTYTGKYSSGAPGTVIFQGTATGG